MTETIQTAMDRLMTISVEPQDYVAEDGLLYCGSCKLPRKRSLPNGKNCLGVTAIRLNAGAGRLQGKAREEERARLHYEKVQRLKLQGFTDWAMQHWTFANDHGQNPQMQLAQRYVATGRKCRKRMWGCCSGAVLVQARVLWRVALPMPDGTGSGRLHDEFCPNHE